MTDPKMSFEDILDELMLEEPTPSYAACSMCDYRIACPAAER